jgi:Tfp pilus assembly protein PilP
MFNRVSTILSISLLAAAVGCGDPPADEVVTAGPALARLPAPAAVKAQGPVTDRMPEIQFDKQRDPFMHHQRRVEPTEIINVQSKVKGKAFDLDQLKLVGVVQGEVEPVAMFRNPQGRGYMARRGDYLGRTYARIKIIERNKVVVEFPFPSVSEGQKERIIALAKTAQKRDPENSWSLSR